jgi:hypothetical protein
VGTGFCSFCAGLCPAWTVKLTVRRSVHLLYDAGCAVEVIVLSQMIESGVRRQSKHFLVGVYGQLVGLRFPL